MRVKGLKCASGQVLQDSDVTSVTSFFDIIVFHKFFVMRSLYDAS